MINEFLIVFDVVIGKKFVKEKFVVNNIFGIKVKFVVKVVSIEKLFVRLYYYECVVFFFFFVGILLLFNL